MTDRPIVTEAVPQDGIERARDGQYSCATCGMFMLEPCEHWKLSPALERLVNEADDDIREGPGLHRWAVREAIRQAAAAQSQEIAELKEQARLREAQTEEARAREAHEADWWADWLIDAVACATQDRRYLRGEEHADNFAIEAIIANGKKAIESYAASEVSRVRRETLAEVLKEVARQRMLYQQERAFAEVSAMAMLESYVRKLMDEAW